MAGKQKHAERSKRSHKSHEATRSSGLYRMASIVNRSTTIRRNRTQQKGAT